MFTDPYKIRIERKHNRNEKVSKAINFKAPFYWDLFCNPDTSIDKCPGVYDRSRFVLYEGS